MKYILIYIAGFITIAIITKWSRRKQGYILQREKESDAMLCFMWPVAVPMWVLTQVPDYLFKVFEYFVYSEKKKKNQ